MQSMRYGAVVVNARKAFPTLLAQAATRRATSKIIIVTVYAASVVLKSLEFDPNEATVNRLTVIRV